MSDQESDGNNEESSPACSLRVDVDDSIVINEASDEEAEGKAHKNARPSTESDSSSAALPVVKQMQLESQNQ